MSKDTGLVRYAHDNGTLSGLSRNEHGPWCLHSQAEELLAAERAEHDNTITTLTSLIADNAAKDARIKELETELTQTVLKKKNNADLFWKAREKFNNRIKSLEAKLAAAQKALESAAKDFDVLFCTPRVTETKSTDDQFDLVIEMAGRFGTDARKALAVMREKER